MAWIYGVDQVDSYQSEIGADQRSAPTTSLVKLSKAGWVRLRGVRGMDAAAKPPRTGLRRPRNRTHPAIPRNARFCR